MDKQAQTTKLFEVIWLQKAIVSELQEDTSEQVASQIAKSLEKSTNILASTLHLTWSDLFSSFTILALVALALSFILFNENALCISNLNIRMMNMESELSDVKSILNWILATVLGKTTNRNENTNIKERNILGWELHESVKKADFL